jgi:gamma-glutamylcyclotransferase (GGCT)/AIG2-like uncharacterized protein YtfP
MTNFNVFVYGTLKNGECNHFFLEQARFLGPAATVEEFLMFAGGVPVVVRVPEPLEGGALQDTRRIYGEVYEVDREALLRLDSLEGYREGREHNMYDRVEIEAAPIVEGKERGDKVKTFIYLGSNHNRRWAMQPYTTTNAAGFIDWTPRRFRPVMDESGESAGFGVEEDDGGFDAEFVEPEYDGDVLDLDDEREQS